MNSTITLAGAEKAIEAGRAKARTSVLSGVPAKDLTACGTSRPASSLS
jgi:hypothetical protein